MSFKPQHSARWSLAIRTNFVSFVRKFAIRNDCIYLSLVTLNLFQGLYNIFTGIPRLRYRMFTARCLGLFGISQKRGFAQPYGLGHFVTSTLPKIRSEWRTQTVIQRQGSRGTSESESETCVRQNHTFACKRERCRLMRP